MQEKKLNVVDEVELICRAVADMFDGVVSREEDRITVSVVDSERKEVVRQFKDYLIADLFSAIELQFAGRCRADFKGLMVILYCYNSEDDEDFSSYLVLDDWMLSHLCDSMFALNDINVRLAFYDDQTHSAVTEDWLTEQELDYDEDESTIISLEEAFSL